MNHFGIKALVLACAAAVLFLVCFGIAKGTSLDNADSSTAYNLSAWLAKNNITIDRRLIDTDAQTVRAATLKSTVSDRKKTAETMLGSAEDAGADTYTGENGTVVFAKDTFTMTAAKGAFGKSVSGIDRYNSGKKAEEIAKAMGFDLSGSVISTDEDGSIFTAYITKTIDAKPVFDDCITLTADKDGLISASGVWYVPEDGIGNERRAKPAADALAELLERLGGEKTSVSSMTLGYRMKHSGNITEIVPVWRFEIEDRDDIYIEA